MYNEHAPEHCKAGVRLIVAHGALDHVKCARLSQLHLNAR